MKLAFCIVGVGQSGSGSKYCKHTDRFRNNSATIEFDEVLSCLSCYKLQLGKLISSLQTIQIPVQKSWICRRFIYKNTSSKSM